MVSKQFELEITICGLGRSGASKGVPRTLAMTVAKRAKKDKSELHRDGD